MLDDRALAIKTVLVFEGVDSNHPDDPGGRTRKGVTQAVYDAYRRTKGSPVQSVFQMSDDEMLDIYGRQYLDPIWFDKLPAGTDIVIYDGAVNSGVVQSVKWVQRALGSRYTGKIDGKMGVKTLDAILAVKDQDVLISDILGRRLAFLQALKTWHVFGHGWGSRVGQVKRIGQKLAVGSVGPQPVYVADMHQKADLADAKPIPTASPGALTGGIGGTLTAAAAGSDSFFGSIRDNVEKIAFLPHSADVLLYIDHAQNLVEASAGIVGVLAAAGGAAYFAYARHRAAKLHDALDLLPVPAATPA